jgi:hypothetical protein
MMRFFTTNTFGAGESVELNAVLLGILVAVLVILLPQAVQARSILKEARQRAERKINATGGGGFFIQGELWDQYALDTDKQFEDMRLRLEEIVNPERTERTVAEEEERLAQVEAAVAASTKFSEARAQLIQRIREAGPEEREEARRQLVEGFGNEFADEVFKESEKEPPRPQPTTSPAHRWRPKLRSSFQLPDSDGARGMVLLKIIAAMWAQLPFPQTIRKSGGRISEQDPPAPVTLPNAHAAHKWLNATNEVATLMRIIHENQEKVDSLLDAAEKANYEIASTSDAPQFVKNFDEDMKKLWNSLYRAFATDWESLMPLRKELNDQLAAYETNRPGFAQLGSLVAALIGGWFIFCAAVILPLVATQVPRVVYLYLPLAYYFLVLSLIMIANIRGMLRKSLGPKRIATVIESLTGELDWEATIEESSGTSRDNPRAVAVRRDVLAEPGSGHDAVAGLQSHRVAGDPECHGLSLP